MGKFDPHITVQKGLPSRLRHLRARRKGPSKTKKFARTLDDSSIVEVNRRPVVQSTGLGILSYFASSCNVCGAGCIGEGAWRSSTVARINHRLNSSDGMAKGRVIFAFAEDGLKRVAPVGAMTYHVPKAGTIQVLSADTTTDHGEHHILLVAALLDCAQAIARECGAGRKSTITWTVASQGTANIYRRNYDFTTATKDRNGYHLTRVARY